ncbi:hypothetical protein J1N35_036734 [Gossypium stocksii]|uniref:MATH domain-containing protein n=1 Tax=Gossypium stocksii TaxID=47602 RepID=A0A9D3ZL78_9ROSI|nr:hypothetical protein J1N35_036734 [Gossypium stocksii]
MDVNGLTTKATWKIEDLSGVNGQVTMVTWRIENFSNIKDYKLCSANFTVDGNKWRLSIYPKGNNVDFLSIYLVADSATLASGWSRYAHHGFAVIDQLDFASKEFTENHASWGYPSFLPLSELENPKRGYLLNDACLVEAYVCTDRTVDFISHEFVVKTDSDKLKAKEADCVEAVIDNQKTPTTKPVEITPPSPTQSSSQIAIEPEEPAEEDMNTFFHWLRVRAFKL